MIRFYTENSFTQAQCDNPLYLRKIYDILSYKVENHEHIARRMAKKWRRAAEWDGIKSFFNTKNNAFLTGFLPKVQQGLTRSGIDYAVYDMRYKPNVKARCLDKYNFAMQGIELRDFQRRTIGDFLKAERGVAHLATGAGKTEIAISLTKNLAVPTLFLTHRTNLLRQTAQRFIARCPELEKHIGIFGDGTCEPKAITIATVQSIFAALKRDLPSTKEWLLKYNFLITDEAHRSGASQFHIPASLCNNAYYRLALTATPFMKYSMQDNMYLMGISGDVFTTVSNGELIAKGVLAKPFFKFFEINVPDLRRTKKWRDVYEQGIVENAYRNELIAEQVNKLVKMKSKVLTIVNERKHGKILESLISRYAIKVEYIDGRNDTIERENALRKIRSGELDVIIATNIFDEGIDVQDINGIVLAGGTKSAPALFQRTGRAIRKKDENNYAIIIDFVDRTNKHLLEHSAARYSLVKNEKGFTII